MVSTGNHFVPRDPALAGISMYPSFSPLPDVPFNPNISDFFVSRYSQNIYIYGRFIRSSLLRSSFETRFIEVYGFNVFTTCTLVKITFYEKGDFVTLAQPMGHVNTPVPHASLLGCLSVIFFSKQAFAQTFLI